MRRLIVIAVLLLAVPAFGSGGDFCIPGQTATSYTGGCSAGGDSWGTAVPLCDNATDGTFLLHSTLPNFCATAAVTMTSLQFNQLDGISATGVVCATGKYASYTQNADADEAGITFGTAFSQITSDLDDCDTNDVTDFCVSGAAGVVTSKDLGTGSNCVTTACSNRPFKAEIQIETAAGAGCTSGTTTDIEIIQACFSCP